MVVYLLLSKYRWREKRKGGKEQNGGGGRETQERASAFPTDCKPWRADPALFVSVSSASRARLDIQLGKWVVE